MDVEPIIQGFPARVGRSTSQNGPQSGMRLFSVSEAETPSVQSPYPAYAQGSGGQPQCAGWLIPRKPTARSRHLDIALPRGNYREQL
jgi:hypothetical protein